MSDLEPKSVTPEPQITGKPETQNPLEAMQLRKREKIVFAVHAVEQVLDYFSDGLTESDKVAVNSRLDESWRKDDPGMTPRKILEAVVAQGVSSIDHDNVQAISNLVREGAVGDMGVNIFPEPKYDREYLEAISKDERENLGQILKVHVESEEDKGISRFSVSIKTKKGDIASSRVSVSVQPNTGWGEVRSATVDEALTSNESFDQVDPSSNLKIGIRELKGKKTGFVTKTEYISAVENGDFVRNTRVAFRDVGKPQA